MTKPCTIKYLLASVFLCFGSIQMNAQALLEDFSYLTGTALTANGFVAISRAGTNPIIVTTPGLFVLGCPLSNVGKKNKY
ncbi:MAG: hypothetical protein ACKVOM_12335 [Ferruginibacter sp.]